MELKSYDKIWLPVFKGAFLMLFGVIAMLRILGSIKTLAAIFVMLIGMIALLLIGTGIYFRKTKFRRWTIISGLINLAFCIYLAVHIASPLTLILWSILAWVLFYALSEIIEASLLFNDKNAFAALFLINALLTLLFGYFLYILMGNFTAQGIFYLGVIALVFGITNELSAFLLSRIKEKN
jgi:hypothetical protein